MDLLFLTVTDVTRSREIAKFIKKKISQQSMCLTLHFNHEPVLYNIITCLLLQCFNYFVEFLDLKLPCACLKQALPEVNEYCVAYGLKINKIKPVKCHGLLSECRLIYRLFQLHLNQITH